MRDPKQGRADLRPGVGAGRVRRYEFIEKTSERYQLRQLLQVAGVSRSAYYASVSKPGGNKGQTGVGPSGGEREVLFS